MDSARAESVDHFGGFEALERQTGNRHVPFLGGLAAAMPPAYPAKVAAPAHSILASVQVTCRQRAISAMDFLVRVQRAAGGATSLVSAPAVDTSVDKPDRVVC